MLKREIRIGFIRNYLPSIYAWETPTCRLACLEYHFDFPFPTPRIYYYEPSGLSNVLKRETDRRIYSIRLPKLVLSVKAKEKNN